MKEGYQHPYHSEKFPISMSHLHYMKTLFEAVGPEQVSPHYESLSRSRRGLLFLFFYIGSINTISRMGGWSNNEWLRAMIWHHEYMLSFYLGYIELRHFTYFIGPKFTIFYNVYTRYETKQFCNMWADTTEEQQMMHLQQTKEQLEYMRLNHEYESIKKRSLINYLTNEKLNLEKHFHQRTLNMLRSIKRYEHINMQNQLSSIGTDALKAVQGMMEGEKKQDILDQAF